MERQGKEKNMSKIVVFKITGISPLLQNNPASMLGQKKDDLTTKTNPTPEEDAASKVYKTKDGNFYIPAESFRASIIGKGGAASGRKIGKRTAISVCSASIFTVEAECILLNPKTGKPLKEYTIDTRRAVIQGQGIPRSRPRFDQWMVQLPLEIDEDWIKVEIVEELLNIAGKLSGVGDYRPNKKGSFGRFTAKLEK